jgi:hypothetical protein
MMVEFKITWGLVLRDTEMTISLKNSLAINGEWIVVTKLKNDSSESETGFYLQRGPLDLYTHVLY